MRNTRKKILAMILALVMAMSITASAADTSDNRLSSNWEQEIKNDIVYPGYIPAPDGPIDETNLSNYTAENSRYAIHNGYIHGNAFAFNEDGTRKDHPDPKEPNNYSAKYVDALTLKTTIGSIRETWNYLYENFGNTIANLWLLKEGKYGTKTDNITGEWPRLDYLLSGDADRHFAYLYNNFGFTCAWNYIYSALKTDKFTASIDEGITSMDATHIQMYGNKKGKTNVELTATPEPTATQPITSNQTNTAPVTVTPGKVVTVTVNGVPMQLEAVVVKDANGGATTYFKLRDVGDAVGFQVDWSASTGITVNSK